MLKIFVLAVWLFLAFIKNKRHFPKRRSSHNQLFLLAQSLFVQKKVIPTELAFRKSIHCLILQLLILKPNWYVANQSAARKVFWVFVSLCMQTFRDYCFETCDVWMIQVVRHWTKRVKGKVPPKRASFHLGRHCAKFSESHGSLFESIWILAHHGIDHLPVCVESLFHCFCFFNNPPIPSRVDDVCRLKTEVGNFWQTVQVRRPKRFRSFLLLIDQPSNQHHAFPKKVVLVNFGVLFENWTEHFMSR